jgi:hypothetical protein
VCQSVIFSLSNVIFGIKKIEYLTLRRSTSSPDVRFHHQVDSGFYTLHSTSRIKSLGVGTVISHSGLIQNSKKNAAALLSSLSGGWATRKKVGMTITWKRNQKGVEKEYLFSVCFLFSFLSNLFSVLFSVLYIFFFLFLLFQPAGVLTTVTCYADGLTQGRTSTTYYNYMPRDSHGQGRAHRCFQLAR